MSPRLGLASGRNISGSESVVSFLSNSLIRSLVEMEYHCHLCSCVACNVEAAYNFMARTAQHHMYQGNTEMPMCKSCPSQTRNAEGGSGYCIF